MKEQFGFPTSKLELYKLEDFVKGVDEKTYFGNNQGIMDLPSLNPSLIGALKMIPYYSLSTNESKQEKGEIEVLVEIKHFEVDLIH